MVHWTSLTPTHGFSSLKHHNKIIFDRISRLRSPLKHIPTMLNVKVLACGFNIDCPNDFALWLPYFLIFNHGQINRVIA